MNCNFLSHFFSTLSVHRNVGGNVRLRSNFLENVLVILTSHQLVHKFITPLYYLVDLFNLLLFGLLVMHPLILIVLRTLDCIVERIVGCTLLNRRFSQRRYTLQMNSIGNRILVGNNDLFLFLFFLL